MTSASCTSTSSTCRSCGPLMANDAGAISTSPSTAARARPISSSRTMFAVLNFDSTGHEDLVMDAPTFATGPAADVGFISLNMLVGFAADAVLIGTHHASAQRVENAKGCLIA